MKKIIILSIFIALAVAGVLYAAHKQSENNKVSGPAFPRFASLRNSEANMRTGPGTRYPIEWVYKRQGLPLEIVAKDDDDIWRRIRDVEGVEGWMHKAELSGKRTAVVTGARHDLRNKGEDTAKAVAHLEPGAIGQIMSCTKDWCRLRFENVKGYLRKSDFWGAYPDEIFN